VTSDQSLSLQLLDILNSRYKSQILESSLDLGDAVVRIARNGMLDFFRALKEDAELKMNFLVDITAVDWVDARPERFEVVYHLLSLSKNFRLRIKIYTPEQKPEVDTLVSLWPGASFMERETWDMYGIDFKGHPDQRRILTYDEFQGHPLRKDYPVQGKQPRVPLLHPEVRNTAVDMNRPALVQIKRRIAASVAASKH
jgi:NADH-quinone oxidoreductase subunit C